MAVASNRLASLSWTVFGLFFISRFLPACLPTRRMSLKKTCYQFGRFNSGRDGCVWLSRRRWPRLNSSSGPTGGVLRHAEFVRLRDDKNPKEVVRESIV